MALSFKESKRMTDESPVMTMEATMEDARPVVDYDEDITTFDTGDQNFTRSGNYTWYDTFSDNDFSTVDTNKEITLSPTQVNITQENNSQVIPFEMPRYYDGVDLMGMTIQIHYVNANNAENYAAPINVSYSDDKIRFYWMVSDYATVKDGVLKFEIMATGAITVPSSGESKNYLWRTKPNEKLNVLKSLTGTAMNDPTGDDWYTQFLSTMSQKVGEAQTAATLAAQSAKDAQAVVDGLADTLANYYTKEEVNGFITLLQGDIAKVDGLAKFDVQYDAETQTIKFLNGDKLIKTITLNTDPSAEWVTAFNKTVDAKIDENVSVVQTELTEYKTSNDAAVKNLQDSVGNLPETLQSDYYNKQATNKLLESKAEKASVETVSNDLTVVKNTASGLQNSIDTINSDISDIQEQLKNVKPDPNAGREYDITYEDSKLNLLENGTVKTTVVIQGGGGGGGNSSVITIERLDGSALTVIAGDPAVINYNFTSVDNSGDDTGSATGVWYVGNTKVGTQTIIQGKNSFDVTQYLHSGDNTVKLQVTDSVGSVGTKTWTINVVEFYLESTFDDTLVYSGEVTFRYTPYGNISKTINFTIDGKTLGSTTTAVTGRQLTYAIPAQIHGAHLVEVSMTAEINGKQVTSNKIVKDIMWTTEGDTTPIISCATKTASAKQYSNVAINYTVYDPSSSTTTVTLEVDGAKIATLTVGRTMQTWTWKSADIGTHTLKIVCGSVSKTISVEIKELGITIEPVKTNLAFDFNPAGKTNSDETRLWTDGNNRLTVSDNFDWSNGGYQLDEDGDTYFCVKAGTTANISYKLFGDDAKKLGKNFKLVFKTTNVKNYDATALTCLNGGIGLNIQAQKVTLTSEQNSISLPTCEDDFMEFEFNILPDGAYCDAFYKSSGTYMGVVIRAIASGGRATSGRTWTLVDSNEVGGTTATDKKTSSECWKTIADAGTALHKQAYSASAPAKDEGYVASAGSANTSSSCTGNSASATKLTSSAGSAAQPVYFKDGKPVAGTYTLGDASSKTVRTLGAVGNTGWANKTTDDKYIPTMSFMAYWNGAYSGTSSNLQYCDRGRFGTIVTKGSGDYAVAGHTHNYAGSGSAGGSANSAVKLDSNAGSSVQPVYFSGGKPVAIGYTISSSVPANAKFTDTTYGVASSSSNGLMSSTDKTKLDDFSRVISIQKQIKLTTDWLDTGIAGNSLDTGTYVVQVSGFNSSYTQLYSEIYSGVMSWYSGTTNSGNSSEIFLHNAGLADNNNAIYLRTLRVAGSKTLKLQIACKVAATGTDILTFKFRRLI